jgi:formate hydrogenlyase subunit 4
MIHEAMILEYSGKRLALMEWAAMNKLLIFIVLGGNIFFPWGVSGQLAYGAILIAIAAFVLKTGLFVLSVAGIESTMAKFRIFRVPDLLFTSLVLGMIALSIIMTI